MRAERYTTIWKAAQAIILTYFFLAAINMMGDGVKIVGTNPEYVRVKDPALAYRSRIERVHEILCAPGDVGGDSLIGRKVGALSKINAQGGYVGVEGRALAAAVAAEASPGATVPADGTVEIVGVEADRVVVRHIGRYKDWLFSVFEYAKNPLLALLVGILITAIFQSSSFTTSFVVGLVATVDFPMSEAIPIIMGANIGTSVTGILVSMGYIRRRDEFRRAFAGATVHDFFKILTVLILFPLEVTTGALSRVSDGLAGLVYRRGGTAGGEPTNFIKKAVAPVVEGTHHVLREWLGLSESVTGGVMALVAVVVLFVALVLLVKVLRSLVLRRAESLFDRVLFRNAGIGFCVGLILTASVQSSSVTTSLVVPLLAAGLLTLEQVFPYILGATIGTTVTALAAAFATSAVTEEQARVGLTVACAHLLFNLIGTAIFYPLRWVPIGMAKALANRAAESRRYAVIFVLAVFFGIPLAGIGVHALYAALSGGQ